MRFTVRRLPNGAVSPCCHRPSGGDIACSVDVGVAPTGSTGLALENRLALAVPGSDVPARRASLRRERGRNLLDPTVGLVLQTCGEKPPTTAADRPIQATLLSNTHTWQLDSSPRRAGHRPHVKGFDPDRVEAARNISRGFLHPVLAPIDLTRLEFRDRPFRSPAPVRATLGPGEPLLQHPQPLGLTWSQTRCVQQFTGRQRSRHGKPTVNTDHAAITWTRNRVRDVGERDMPTASPITGDPVGLDTLRHRPRQPEPHPAHFGHPHPTKAAIQSHNVVRFDRDLPKPFVHTGLTPCRAPMRAGEEVLHGLREIPQRLLLHRLTAGTKPPVLGADLGQLRGLLDITRSLAPRLPVLLLLHRKIPHTACVPTVLQEDLLLRSGGQQPKPRHNRKVTTTTDNPDVAGQPHTGIGFPPRTEAQGT